MRDSSTLTNLDMPHSVRERMAHIERHLFWKGEIKRADITDAFAVNPQQAATDFATYLRLAPGNMDYNKNRKRYVPLPSFRPKFIKPGSVDEFVAIESPAVAVEPWPLPVRTASSETLQALVGAIRDRLSIEVAYQSMTDPVPSWRWLTPHAFSSDGERWHVRAFCQKRNAFRDFVVGRIAQTRGTRPGEVSATEDMDWNTWVTVRLSPNPELSADQRAAIAAEYQMPDGQSQVVRLRQSMVFYLRARFTPAPTSVAVAHQLVISDVKNDPQPESL
jgi:hypothetical protein